MALDGANEREITRGPENDHPPSWSPDVTRLAFARTVANGIFRIMVVTPGQADAGGGASVYNLVESNSIGTPVAPSAR
jgi:Tol biopolymer transport system component